MAKNGSSRHPLKVDGYITEEKGFEPLRRKKPTYRISNPDPSAAWVLLLILN